MAITAEKRLTALEDELKALKATYAVYGGALELYDSWSETYNLGNTTTEIQVKFTPTYTRAGNILISSVIYKMAPSGGILTNYSNYAYENIQDGSGSVIIRATVLGGTAQIGVITTSPGTFTRIA